MNETIISAPGKILWIGGYAVLERPNVSMVTGVDKRVYARATQADGIRLVSRQFGFDVPASFTDGKLVLEPETPAAKFVAAAVRSTLTYIQYKGKNIANFKLETVSDPAFGVKDKAGLGSSAAVTVASVAAILGFHGIDPSKERDLVFKLAQYAHSDAQGGKVGSGFDIAAAALGASHYIRFSPSFITEHPFPQNMDEKWDHELSEVPFPKEFRIVVANIVGQSASTSEMVKKVNEWKARAPIEYRALMAKLNEVNRQTIDSLRAYNKGRRGEDLDRFIDTFEIGRELTRQLGEKSGAPIEPPELGELIKEAKDNGAMIAKLPGAGGGDAIAAICVSEAAERQLRTFLSGYQKVKVKPLDLKLSNEGLRKESSAAFEEIARRA